MTTDNETDKKETRPASLAGNSGTEERLAAAGRPAIGGERRLQVGALFGGL